MEFPDLFLSANAAAKLKCRRRSFSPAHYLHQLNNVAINPDQDHSQHRELMELMDQDLFRCSSREMKRCRNNPQRLMRTPALTEHMRQDIKLFMHVYDSLIKQKESKSTVGCALYFDESPSGEPQNMMKNWTYTQPLNLCEQSQQSGVTVLKVSTTVALSGQGEPDRLALCGSGYLIAGEPLRQPQQWKQLMCMLNNQWRTAHLAEGLKGAQHLVARGGLLVYDRIWQEVKSISQQDLEAVVAQQMGLHTFQGRLNTSDKEGVSKVGLMPIDNIRLLMPEPSAVHNVQLFPSGEPLTTPTSLWVRQLREFNRRLTTSLSERFDLIFIQSNPLTSVE